MTSELKLDEGSDTVVVKGGMKVAFNASGVQGATITVAKNGTVAMQTASNETASKATVEIGVRERSGDHKGEIYGGIFPADNKPIWFSEAPSLMDHYAAAAWAEGQGGSLPTRKQGDYLTALKPLNESAEVLKGKLEVGPAHPASRDNLLSGAPPCAGPDGGGAFTEILNRGTSFPVGFVWLAEPLTGSRFYAWCQRLSDGDQYDTYRGADLPVLCVRR